MDYVTIFNTWIIMLVLIVLAPFCVSNSPLEETPRGLQNAMEAVVEIFDGLRNPVGKLMPLESGFLPFRFILCPTSAGLGASPPTADCHHLALPCNLYTDTSHGH